MAVLSLELNMPRQQLIYKGPIIKLLIMGVITLVLLLPLARVEHLISERQYLQYDAKANIATNWGGKNTLHMPVLVVSYTREVASGFVFKKGEQATQTVQQEAHKVYVPMEEINTAVKMTTEMRHYGIYELPVYLIEVQSQGFFSSKTLQKLDQEIPDLEWDRVELVLPVSQPRSLRSISELEFNQQQLVLDQKFNTQQFAGLSAKVPVNIKNNENITMSVDMTLAGSEGLAFLPMAGVSQVQVQSDWANPSFGGAFLPSKRTISAEGFSAQWSVMDLNLNLPSWWLDEQPKPISSQSEFGFQLYQPVDIYQQNMRSIKYSILVIALSFLLFFLLEIYLRIEFHPIQYVMVGAALSLFYLLLMAFSEHVGFSRAYMIATTAVVIVVGWYGSGILNSYRKGLAVGISTMAVYAFLYFLIQSQDYALVIGATVLFVLFSFIMIFSRHLDWSQITQSTR
ncbi:cell envelope integrity protein CreD [Marinicella sp. W31]|uniref:cell envelope integrity protein CreD n=1 Tax=Marinicella sp. W31 TaxID=3023713 RepID=UPI00375749D0